MTSHSSKKGWELTQQSQPRTQDSCIHYYYFYTHVHLFIYISKTGFLLTLTVALYSFLSQFIVTAQSLIILYIKAAQVMPLKSPPSTSNIAFINFNALCHSDCE